MTSRKQWMCREGAAEQLYRFQVKRCHVLWRCNVLIHELICLCFFSHSVLEAEEAQKPKGKSLSFHLLQRSLLWNTEFLSFGFVVPLSFFFKEWRDCVLLAYSWRESCETHKQPRAHRCECAHVSPRGFTDNFQTGQVFVPLWEWILKVGPLGKIWPSTGLSGATHHSLSCLAIEREKFNK